MNFQFKGFFYPTVVDKNTASQIEAEITTNFDGWFRDRVLSQLYTDLDDRAELAQLNLTEQTKAKDSLIKLALITIPRILFGVSGIFLLVFLTVRLIIISIQQRKERSFSEVLIANLSTPWSTPWDWEIVWQVFVVGFFFVGQFLLPIIFSTFVNPATLNTQGQGLYVFSSYVLMASLGISVLYLSIKAYLPLPRLV